MPRTSSKRQPSPARFCMREGCGRFIPRGPTEPPSMYRKRWFCSRLCASAVREFLARRPPTYHGDPHQRALTALARAHPLELYCLYRSAVLADDLQHDRVQGTLPLIELNEQEAL